MSSEIVVDALPYIDQGYDEPSIRDAAIRMVEEETRRFRPTKNYLEHMPPLNLNAFETQMMRNEFERFQQRLPMEMLSMRRYELPPPPPGKLTDIGAWNDAVNNSFAQLEHQSIRLMNLELLLEYGPEVWKIYLDYVKKQVDRAQREIVELRKEIQEVNWSRKASQMEAGAKLKELETHWVGLVSKNYEIEQACALLQQRLASTNGYHDEDE